MYMQNQGILEEIALAQEHSIRTQSTYKRALQLYSDYNNMSMIELINEAENEEENGVRWKHRTLKKRLLNFRHYLIQNYKKNSVKTYFLTIVAVYKYYEIEIGTLPKMNNKNVMTNGKLLYDEIITHEEISKIINSCPAWFKAYVLFTTSSGCARKEAYEITIGDLKKSVKEYTESNNILDMLHDLEKIDDVIPTFKLKRAKTNKYYYTFCSPEAVKAITSYLLSKRVEILEDGSVKTIKLDDDDHLFAIDYNYIVVIFNYYNNKYDLGKGSDNHNRFRSHMMRKFHSNNLLYDGMAKSDINSLQGRAESVTNEAYFSEDPNILKKKYIEHLPCLLIDANVNKLDYKSSEYIELESKTRMLEEENDKYREVVDNIDDVIERKIREAIGGSDDEFDDLFS